MLVEWMIGIGYSIFNLIFKVAGILPDLPQSIINVINDMFDLLYSSINLVGIFIDLNMVKILIPFVIAIVNFDKIFKLVMFILRKIPFINIK